MPVEDESDEDEKRPSNVNQLFHQLNQILKDQIDNQVKKELHIGDKIETEDKNLQISVQDFSTLNGFPVNFKPKDDEVLEDKTVIALVDDFDGSSEFVIKKESSSTEESSEDEIKNKSTDSPTKQKAPTTLRSTSDASSSTTTESTKKTSDSQTLTSSTQSTTDKNQKLLEPVFYSH